MKQLVLQVEGMSCQHCVKAVSQAVGALPGVKQVKVDLAAKTVTVDHEMGADALPRIREAIEEQGYDVK
ncbi:MAG: copper ion binding protein [Eubacteriales bacterium]